MHPAHRESFRTDDLNPHFAAIRHIILESFRTVMPETVVIADNQAFDIQFALQYVRHETAGRHGSQFRSEIQRDTGISTRRGQPGTFFLIRGQQLRQVVRM